MKIYFDIHIVFRTRELDRIKEIAREKIGNFIMNHMAEYFKFVRKRLEHEVNILIP